MAGRGECDVRSFVTKHCMGKEAGVLDINGKIAQVLGR